MRRVVPALLLIVLAGLLDWAFIPRPVPVELAEVAPRLLDVTVEEEGEARIREVFTVSAPSAGKLRRITLHAGDSVTEGETVVATIGPAAPELLDARDRAVAEALAAAAQAAVDLAHAQLTQAEATLDFMTEEANRASALIEKPAISQRLYESAIREQKTAQAALDSARFNLVVRARELESAQAIQSADTAGGTADCCVNIVAPVSGRVLRVLTESEQVVQIGTPILEIGNPGNLEVTVDLLSRDAVRVRPGAEATLTGWGGPPIAARVDRVEPSAVTKVSALGINEQRVTVRLRLVGPEADWQGLGHGFRVIARISLWRGEDVLTLPVGALFRDGSDWATYVVAGNRVALRRIELGERNETFAQVLGGLSAGDRVVLHPSDLVADGVKVRP